jgi:23S rRNA (adenine2503-C2)-methyltransferase
MKIIDKIVSKIDGTIKFVIKTDDNLIVEFAYIYKKDNKHIICVPSQTSCCMKCQFCHMTDISDKIKLRDLGANEIHHGVKMIYQDLKLQDIHQTLLVSYMGVGEPLLNYINVANSMITLRCSFWNINQPIRFAFATSLPKSYYLNLFKFMNLINKADLNVKMHLSLHYINDDIREQWMQNSLPVMPSITALEFYHELTGNPVEIHYALIKGVNDSIMDAEILANLIANRNIPVKFLLYNEKESIDYHPSNYSQYLLFQKILNNKNINVEYYAPNGIDIGASCGQILADYYLKYNLKESLKG